jgi:hypothetical protein
VVLRVSLQEFDRCASSILCQRRQLAQFYRIERGPDDEKVPDESMKGGD